MRSTSHTAYSPAGSSTRAHIWRLAALGSACIGFGLLLLGCGEGSTGDTPTNVLYVTSNDPAAGSNVVLGYSRAANGSLTPLPGSPYAMGGTGVSNPAQLDGPDDDDQNLVVS